MMTITMKKWFLMAFFTVIFVFTGSAWSHDYYGSSSTENVSRETLDGGLVRGSIPIPAHKARFCSSLLKSTHTPNSARSSADDQRKVGKVAALSMILGARFALAPTNQKQDARQNDYAAAHPAQIIAAYRKCRKEQSLRTAAASNNNM